MTCHRSFCQDLIWWTEIAFEIGAGFCITAYSSFTNWCTFYKIRIFVFLLQVFVVFSLRNLCANGQGSERLLYRFTKLGFLKGMRDSLFAFAFVPNELCSFVNGNRVSSTLRVIRWSVFYLSNTVLCHTVYRYSNILCLYYCNLPVFE